MWRMWARYRWWDENHPLLGLGACVVAACAGWVSAGLVWGGQVRIDQGIWAVVGASLGCALARWPKIRRRRQVISPDR